MRCHHAPSHLRADRVLGLSRVTALLRALAGLLVVLAVSSAVAAPQRDFFPLTLDTRGEGVTISGHVRDDFNARPIRNATVVLFGQGGQAHSAATSSTGYFRIDHVDPAAFLAEGSSITVSHPGYFVAEQPLLVGPSMTISLSTRTVALVHGLGADPGDWGAGPENLPARLIDEGYRVVSLDAGGFPANVDRVRSVLTTMSAQLEVLCLDIGIESFDVVAHGMGGIVARSYLSSAGGRDHVRRLVTLGTPHHGSYVANAALTGVIATDVALSAWAGVPIPDDSIAAVNTALLDLAVGSEYLRALNYGRSGDGGREWPCRSSFDEHLGYGSADILSIAGTEPGLGFGIVEAVASGCWFLDSDGIVLEPRAYYHDGATCTDVDLAGLNGVDCSDGAHHKQADDPERELMKNPCIIENVLEILATGQMQCPGGSTADPLARRSEGPRTMLPILAGSVAPGDTVEVAAAIDAMSVADFLCMSAADSLLYALRSPSGLVIDPAYAAVFPDADYTQIDGVAMYTVTAPEAGQWIHMISTYQSAAPDSFRIVTSFDGQVTLAASVDGNVAPSGEFTLRAEFRATSGPIPTGTVSVDVTRPDGTVVAADLVDDGTGVDEIAGDGNYTTTHPAGGTEGMFIFAFLATVDPSDPDSPLREDRQVAWASSLPDVVIGQGGVVFDAAPLPLGGILRSTVTFSNQGTAVADSVLLRLENVTFATVLAESLVTALGPGQSVTFEADWLGVRAGTFTVRASADLLGAQIEADLGSNFAEAAIEVIYADGVTSVPGDDPTIGDPSDPISSNVLLRRGHPNPMQGSRMTIGFRVPSGAGEVELAVFDVRGRRVRRVVSEALPPGEHERIWDGKDRSGAPVASGVYFWRLEVGSQVEIQKMVVLR